MSTASNDQGRAYEYAWIMTLESALSAKRETRLIKNSSFQANQNAWGRITPEMRTTFLTSAEAAVRAILEAEPRLEENAGDELTLAFQKDSKGIKGDVRDIVLSRSGIEWEIGLSIKHNHDAIKHCRLSYKLDFGENWFGVPCSDDYWSSVKPVFDMLKSEEANGTNWSDLPNKEDDIYIPLLLAFATEIKRAYKISPEMPRKMVEYLIGYKDYYKIIGKDSERMTLIHTFNVHGTLNKPSKIKVSAITIPVVDLPTRMVALEFKPESKNTLEMYLDNGWELSFRIHNAETKAVPSLKFDIKFMGMPGSVLTISCQWK